MSKRFENTRLIYIVLGLLVILILTVTIKIPKEKGTLKNTIVEFDTSRVSKIILNNRIGSGNTVEFDRLGYKWTVQQGNVVSQAQDGAVQNLFAEVLYIKPQSLAAIDMSKWKEFNLTDSLATRIRFLNSKGKILADVMIGKLDLKQAEKPYMGYSGNNIQMISYVRLYNSKEVYAIDGLIPFSFNVKFDDWRNHTLIKVNKKDITDIHFIFPADSSYDLIKKDSLWYAGDMETDSLNAENYLNSLSLINGDNFIDGFKPDSDPLYQITVKRIGFNDFSIKCYHGDTDDEFILNSSFNPEAFFSCKRDEVFNQIFKTKNYFLKPAAKK